MSYKNRHKKFIGFLADKRLDAFLVRKKENIAYFTGTKGEDAVFFISAGKSVLITDSRYKEEYGKSAAGCSVEIAKNKDLSEIISGICDKAYYKAIGFEADFLTYQAYAALKKRLTGKRLVPVTHAVETLRMLKDEGEILAIRQACRQGCKLMNYAVRAVKPGISENTLKRKIELYALKNNITLAGFDMIVASGTNASMPHAGISDRRMREQEMVTIDLGAMYSGYNSDLTRTVFLGRINHKYSRIYDIVLASQDRAIESLRPGIYAKDIDAVSRRYISDRGMGSFFIHSLGHGIGREIHEIPAISQNSGIKFKKGMVITIEPGVYIPGWGGIRIEDTVLITKNGCEVLTKKAVKHR